MIEIIIGLSSPRMEGELESTTVTVELNVGSEEDVDKDTNDRTLEIVTVELIVGSDVIGLLVPIKIIINN